MMPNLRDLILNHIDENEAEDFALWAFGEEYQSQFGAYNFIKRWNSLHRDLMKLDGSGTISEDVPLMIDLWKLSKNNQV